MLPFFLTLTVTKEPCDVANNVLELSPLSAWKEGKLQLQRRPLIKVRVQFTTNKNFFLGVAVALHNYFYILHRLTLMRH